MIEISSRFTGPAMLRTADRFEMVLPEPTEVEERLQAALLADKMPKVPQTSWLRKVLG